MKNMGDICELTYHLKVVDFWVNIYKKNDRGDVCEIYRK